MKKLVFGFLVLAFLAGCSGDTNITATGSGTSDSGTSGPSGTGTGNPTTNTTTNPAK
jgi:hypothetical protein